MKRLAIFLNALVMTLWMLASPARAESAADLAKPIAAFCDDQTICVSHVDLTRIDVDAIAESTREFITAMNADDGKKEIIEPVNALAATAGATIDRLRKGGVTHIYYLIGLDEIMYSGGVIVVPMESAEKAKAAADLFAFALNKDVAMGEFNGFSQTEVIGTSLLISDAASLARAKTAKGKRPDIAEAFAAAGDSPIHLLLTPSPAMWKIAAELMPAMPRELGGGSTEELLKGVRSLAISITPPMAPENAADKPPSHFELRMHVAADDEAAAKRAGKLIESMKTEIAKLPECQENEAVAKALFKIFTPRLEGAGLTITITRKELLSFAGVLARPAARAREHAKTALAAGHVRQLLIGAQAYQHEHANKWPASLKDIPAELKMPAELFLSPLDGKPFVYRAPTEKDLKDSGLFELPVIWDAQGKDGMRIIGFADGHSEGTTQKRFDEVFKKAGITP